jgi:hypothetical protein
VPRRSRWLVIAGALVAVSSLGAQRARPVLDGRRVVEAADSLWNDAVIRETRDVDGAPGPRHWVQSARYEMHATLSPSLRSLQAEGLLRYRNRSPDTLLVVALSLAQNLFAPNAPHDEPVPVTGGVTLDGFCIAKLTHAPAERLCRNTLHDVTADLRVDFTVAWLTLPAPLLPGDSVDVRARWHFRIPTEYAPRMGSDGSVALLAYWYPQFRVYDDVAGWDADPYLATGEFYMDHADFDVQVTVPSAMLVAATGVLRNPESVLTPLARERLQRAARSRSVVPIVSDSMRRTHGGTLPGTTLTWRFTADSVRDFTFYASRDVVWDAVAALVPGSGEAPDTVLVHALYRPRVRSWRSAADDGRRSIEHFSRLLWPYPWPQMTVVEGIVDGGMEYPMLTVVSVGPDPRELRSTIAHEIGHMWFPMQVGTNERRFAWVDEGFASWLERSLMVATTGRDDDDEGLPVLYRMMATRAAPSMMVHADHYGSAMAYTMASYDKLVVVLRAFAAEYGDSTLLAGIRALGARWSGRHPYPADITRTVFAGAGDERETFVREWVRGTGTFDASIGSVTRARDTLVVEVRVRGGARLSVPVEIRRDDGTVETILIAAAAFRLAPVQTLRIAQARRVRRITLDPRRTRPDIDTGNQQWTP